jgi:hypothetical protein
VVFGKLDPTTPVTQTPGKPHVVFGQLDPTKPTQTPGKLDPTTPVTQIPEKKGSPAGFVG